jgi:hypothetical protein
MRVTFYFPYVKKSPLLENSSLVNKKNPGTSILADTLIKYSAFVFARS